MQQIEKEHTQSALMSRKKEALVEHIMCLEHNNNVLHDTINQQAENFKKLLSEEVNYWKREAIKNAAELGELHIWLETKGMEHVRKLQEIGFSDEIIKNYKTFEDECVSKGFSFKSLLEARERQTPKEIAEPGHLCPNCKSYLAKEPISDNYCFSCGQKINWSV